jgi:hypothetical protein
MTVAQDVQILANHATVVQNGAVIGDESRDFSERIERNERAVSIDRMRGRRKQLDAFSQAQLVGADQAFTDEGRCRGVKKFHRLSN